MLIRCIGVEHAPVSAGFNTLSHNAIQSGLFDQPGFLQVGGGCQQADAGPAQRGNLLGCGQSEVEADHRRTLLQQHLQHGIVFDKTRVARGQRGGQGQAGIVEQGAQVLQPGRFPLGIRRCRRVAEQVDIHRVRGQSAGLLDHLLRLLHVARPYAQRAQPTGIGYCCGQLGSGNARHRRLNDGKLDTKACEKSSSAGHGFSLLIGQTRCPMWLCVWQGQRRLLVEQQHRRFHLCRQVFFLLIARRIQAKAGK